LTALGLWQVSVCAEPAREEQIAAQLEERLEAPVVVYRNADTGALTISAYLPEIKETPGRLRRELASRLALAPKLVSIQRLRRQNWATSWKRHFKPIQIGGRLLIKPSWSRRRARPGQRVVILDPGLTFGTGQHATTAFCLRQLSRCRNQQSKQSFLDIGTGSGILAIAAAKLGYGPVEAFDFDPEAVRAAQRNARKNRVDDQLSLRRDDLTALPTHPPRRFDVICANLTYDLLAAQAKKLSRLLAPQGRLIVAGILDEQFEIVTNSFQRFGLTLVKVEVKNIWRSGQYAFHCRVQREKGSNRRKCI
jgi:ribosomal protein L11 methyltransferase